jgi:hypothetical protein
MKRTLFENAAQRSFCRVDRSTVDDQQRCRFALTGLPAMALPRWQQERYA